MDSIFKYRSINVRGICLASTTSPFKGKQDQWSKQIQIQVAQAQTQSGARLWRNARICIQSFRRSKLNTSPETACKELCHAADTSRQPSSVRKALWSPVALLMKANCLQDIAEFSWKSCCCFRVGKKLLKLACKWFCSCQWCEEIPVACCPRTKTQRLFPASSHSGKHHLITSRE